MIHTISPQEQCCIHRWYCRSIALFVAVLLMAVLIEAPRWYFLKKIGSEKKALTEQIRSFDSTIKKKHALKQEEQLLKARMAKVDRIITPQKHLFDYLSIINQACASTTCIQSFKREKKSFSLRVTCADTQHALHLVNQLNEQPLFRTIALHDIHQQGEGQERFLALIKGSL